MINWEETNRAKIPESYKEWLRFSGKCHIAGNTATFWGPNEFHSDYVPKGLVVIGEIIGDGEVVYFSKDKGIFVRVFEGKTTEINDFAGVLKEIIKLMDDKPILSEERYLEILQKIKERTEYIANSRDKNFYFIPSFSLGVSPINHPIITSSDGTISENLGK